MSYATAPVLAGLAIGAGFIVLFSMLFPFSQIFELRITRDEAVEIAVHDLTSKYVKNPPVIKIYAIVDKQAQEAAYPTVETFLSNENYTLVMAHTAVNRTYYFVDANTGSMEECQLPYCTSREQGMNALKGRFAWMVDLVTQCDNYPHHKTAMIYAIDGKTGQILWRHYGTPEQQEQREPFVCS